MLESLKRAYDRNAFTEECPGQIDLETTEVYVQILKPAYKVSIGFQKTIVIFVMLFQIFFI